MAIDVKKLLLEPGLQAKLLGMMKATASLSNVSRRVLLELLTYAEARSFDMGESVCNEGVACTAFFVILSGSVRVEHEGSSVAQLSAGHTFAAQAALNQSVYPATIVAESPTVVLSIPSEKVHNLLLTRSALRLTTVNIPRTADTRSWLGEVVRLDSRVPGLPLSMFTELLAQTIVADFPSDRVLVIGGPGQETGVDAPGPDGVYRVSMTGGAPATLNSKRCDFDYVFIPSGSDILPVDLHVLITIGMPAAAARDPDRYRSQPTVIISDTAPIESTLVGEMADEALGIQARDAVFLELQPRQIESSFRPNVPLDDAVDRTTRDAMSRWARAVTDRRVGVALSGGGAWGFYHVYALRRLQELGVPIDIISSASFGSLVGAYYCAREDKGLDDVLELAERRFLNLGQTALLAIASTACIEFGVNHALNSVQLNRLTRRFAPVTTDLTTGKSFLITGGSIGLAVRASSSAPGLWGPTILEVAQGEAHFVDGCIADNMPSCVLPALGADLSLAINCFPFALRKVGLAAFGWLGRFVESISPLGRVFDAVCSGSVLLNSSGVFEGAAADVRFNAMASADPLRLAFDFRYAQDFLDEAAKNEELGAALDRTKALWEAMKWRRDPSATAAPTGDHALDRSRAEATGRADGPDRAIGAA